MDIDERQHDEERQAQEEEVDVIVLAFIKVSLDEPFATRHADTLCRMPLVQRAL